MTRAFDQKLLRFPVSRICQKFWKKWQISAYRIVTGVYLKRRMGNILLKLNNIFYLQKHKRLMNLEVW
jgi:hypothetical protein